MIKFLCEHGRQGAALLGLALSEDDLERLRAGATLSFGVADLGADLRARGSTTTGAGKVLIVLADEEELEKRLRALGMHVSPAALPRPRLRALPGKGAPRRRSSAAVPVARRTRIGT